jgi:septal ring factor EnvC (AmiA/AmiB activator)
MRRNGATALTWCVLLAIVLASGDSLAQQLQETVGVRGQANGEGKKSQEKIDSLSDQTDKLLSEYRSTLKQIESLRVYNRQMEELIAAQETELASLRDQIDNVELVGRGVTPLMLNMIAALEQFVSLDVPFLEEERSMRVASLAELMNRSDVSNSEKYRRITEAYQIENEYGRTIEAYRGELPEGGTVDFLRVGRIALVYQSLDGSEGGVWDQQARAWKPLDSSYRTAIKEGLRIARKQAAPDLIRLPLPAAGNAGGQG